VPAKKQRSEAGEVGGEEEKKKKKKKSATKVGTEYARVPGFLARLKKVRESPAPNELSSRVVLCDPAGAHFSTIYSAEMGETILFASEAGVTTLSARGTGLPRVAIFEPVEGLLIGSKQTADAARRAKTLQLLVASDADDNFERFALDIAEHALLRTVFEDIAELVLPAMDVSYLGCPLALRTFDTYVGGY
jgi:hypothetical protein